MTKVEKNVVDSSVRLRGAQLVHQSYGKSNVRLTKVSRNGDHHDLQELCVDISLEGDFEETYTTGDNSKIIATDSMKNTIYVLAAENNFSDIESFAQDLCLHFIETYEQVHKAKASITQELWRRIQVDGEPHPHSFMGAGDEKRNAWVEVTKDSTSIESGITGLRVVKTTDSAFEGFIRDKYTTLPEVKDRIFGTSVSARWSYNEGEADFGGTYQSVRDTILRVFANHMSLSVQQTLFEIAQTALASCISIKEISLTMPNEHRVPFPIQNFGLPNRNEISITTSEPSGLISATVARKMD